MSRNDTPLRFRLVSRVATVALLSGLAAGCSSAVERFGSPIYTGGTQNQRDILTGNMQQPSYDDIVGSGGQPAQGNGQVVRGALPPVGGSAPSTTASISSGDGRSSGVPIIAAQGPRPVPLYSGGATAQQPQPPARVKTSVQPSGGQRGWTTAGGTIVTLGEGESLASVSRRYGVPVDALQAANNLQGDPSLPRSGQQIVIPSYNYGTSVAAAPAAPRTVRTEPVRVASSKVAVPDVKPVPSNVTKPREASAPATTGSIARATPPRRKPETVAAAPTRVRAVAAETPAAPAPRKTVAAAPAPVAETPAETKVATAVAAPDTGSQAGDGEANRFRWPVKGRIISSFGMKPGGTRNDGINLAVPEGTEVRSVESGTVIYAGNELKGYGNLVLVRHEDGWVSAYAHNSSLEVRRGDTVRRGDVIAKAGSTGSVTQPQLHFELRRGNKPVDPINYLSKV